HVSDGIGRGREARREHEVIAPREITYIRAILIHERQALDAPLLWPGFVDEHDATVEIAFVSGEPLIDRVRDDMGDATPVVGRRRVLLAMELLAGKYIPQPKLRLQPALALGHTTSHQRLGVDLPPIGKARQSI